jgi:RsmE family RNA methyltransferase
MNLVLVEPGEVRADGTALLRDRRARHVREVHRAAVGDVLRVGIVGGAWGDGTVVALEPDLVLALQTDRPPPPKPGLDLLLAMPRPKILRKVLQSATSLGVERIVLVNAARVEKSYFDSPSLEPAAIRAELLLGLEQARDTLLPEVRIHPRFKPFVEDELPTLWPESVAKRLAHPTSERSLESAAPAPDERAALAIGPEGGWVPYEVARLEEAGFAAFTAGPRILRVDVALPFLVGALLRGRAR